MKTNGIETRGIADNIDVKPRPIKNFTAGI